MLVCGCEEHYGRAIPTAKSGMSHVFITGAAGFIGGHTVQEFVRQGWHVLALVHRRSSADLANLAAAGRVTCVHGDLTDEPGIEKVVRLAMAGRGAALDAIVHCAGRASDVGWRSEFHRANLKSVLTLVHLTRQLGVRRFVSVSTTDVYGLRDFSGETELDLPLRNNTRNLYPEFKLAAENRIRADLSPEQFAIIRPAAVWGPGDPTLTPRILAFLRLSPWIVHFGPWRGRNRWPLAHVRNVATAIYLAATRPEAGGQAINVLDPEWTSVDEFYHLLADTFLPGKRFRTVVVPLWLGKAMGRGVAFISDALNLDRPFLDPSYYAVMSVSHSLDFSNCRFLDLMAAAGRAVVTRTDGMAELGECRRRGN